MLLVKIYYLDLHLRKNQKRINELRANLNLNVQLVTLRINYWIKNLSSHEILQLIQSDPVSGWTAS